MVNQGMAALGGREVNLPGQPQSSPGAGQAGGPTMGGFPFQWGQIPGMPAGFGGGSSTPSAPSYSAPPSGSTVFNGGIYQPVQGPQGFTFNRVGSMPTAPSTATAYGANQGSSQPQSGGNQYYANNPTYNTTTGQFSGTQWGPSGGAQSPPTATAGPTRMNLSPQQIQQLQQQGRLGSTQPSQPQSNPFGAVPQSFGTGQSNYGMTVRGTPGGIPQHQGIDSNITRAISGLGSQPQTSTAPAQAASNPFGTVNPSQLRNTMGVRQGFSAIGGNDMPGIAGAPQGMQMRGSANGQISVSPQAGLQGYTPPKGQAAYSTALQNWFNQNGAAGNPLWGDMTPGMRAGGGLQYQMGRQGGYVV